MSHVTRRSEQHDSHEPPTSAAAASTRVDAPHVSGSAEAADPSTPWPLLATDAEGVALGVSAVVGEEPLESSQVAAQIVQQVRSQASQLAAHLRRQQSAVDHREAEVNARLGALESQFRTARLWLSERQHEFNERREMLDRRQQELEVRTATLGRDEAACQALRTTTERELRRREAALETREAVLATRLAQIADTRAAAKSDWEKTEELLRGQELALAEREMELNTQRAACLARERELDLRLAQLQPRIQQLEAAEGLLAEEQAELHRQRDTFYHDHARWQEQVHSALQRVRDERQQFARDVEKKKQALAHRRSDLDARRTAIQQLRDEVAHTQRETLELRLATEELWARLCGSMAPAALTQSLGQLRLKMAEQNRLAQADLAEQRQQLQALAKQLSEQHKKLAGRRKELQQWATGRTAEIEEQAATLAAREQELGRQQAEIERLKRRHEDERRSYQQEIRRLLRELRQKSEGL